MAPNDVAELQDQLISRLSWQPRHIMNGMIRIASPATPSSIKRNLGTTACLGLLDSLPLELLHFIFSMLDLQTLSNITQSCWLGKQTVESLPEFRDLIRYAPQAMAALGSTRLIGYFSTSQLHAALRSANCSSCGEFGPFLFLPTCERCCYGCLWRNQSLWVVSISQARTFFHLSAASMRKLPTLLSLPGVYSIRWQISRKRRLRLVSVRAAKELAIKETTSVEALNGECDAGLSLKEQRMCHWLRAAPLEPISPDQLALRRTQELVPNVPNDQFCGMASVPFPSLPAGNRVNNGLWCLGCEEMCREWRPGKPNEAVARFVGSVADVQTTLHLMETIARSQTDFLKHIALCPGAKELVPDVEHKLRQILHTWRSST